jgi:hypothetical protein
LRQRNAAERRERAAGQRTLRSGRAHSVSGDSKYAKKNYVSHTPISQASIVKFVEDNWLAGARLGGGSFDEVSGSVMDMFNLSDAGDSKLILDPRSGMKTASKK